MFFSFPQSHPARGRRIRLYLAEVDDLNMISHPARGRRKPLLRLETKKSHPARGRWKFHLNWEKVAKRITSHPARGRRISQCLRHFCIIQRGASHPARGHRRPPRFTAQFCAAKRGGCFFVKFWAVPDFFRNFSNCGSFCSFCIRIWTVFHWKFAQKSGRNFSVSGVFLCRIPCYNGSKSFHGGQQLRLREFLPL